MTENNIATQVSDLNTAKDSRKHNTGARAFIALAFATVGVKLATFAMPFDVTKLLKESGNLSEDGKRAKINPETLAKAQANLLDKIKNRIDGMKNASNIQQFNAAMAEMGKAFKYTIIVTTVGVWGVRH